MKHFLRYNARHTLHFPGDGKRPQMDPISSSSHAVKSRKRTRSFTEPLWLFRLRQRLFCFAGAIKCSGYDATWDWGPDDNRTCSCCGSIHPDDLMEICRKTLVDDRYGVEGATKSYKVYVRQPGVVNAGHGAIKFYMHHAPANPTKADQDLFAEAQRLTHERMDARWAARSAKAS